VSARIAHALEELPALKRRAGAVAFGLATMRAGLRYAADDVALSAHMRITDGAAWLPTLAAARRLLAQDFAIDHVTLQPSWSTPPAGRRVIPVIADPPAGGQGALH